MINYAVLYQESDGRYAIFMMDGRRVLIANPKSIDYFYRGMAHFKIDCLWVMPDTELSRSATVDSPFMSPVEPDKWDINVIPDDYDRPKYVSFVRFRPQNNDDNWQYNRYLAFPAYRVWRRESNNNGHWDLTTPETLMNTIRYSTDALDVDILFSPGHIGMDVLKTCNRDKDVMPLQFNLASHVGGGLGRSCVLDYKWHRPFTNAEKRKKRLYVFDKNSQYTGAAVSVSFGNGEVLLLSPDSYDKNVTSMWKYSIKSLENTLFNGIDLPCPLDSDKQWASNDLIEAARDRGIELDLHEGIVWPKSFKYMAKWGGILWDAREKLRQPDEEKYPDDIARNNAYETVKEIMVSTPGRLSKEYSKQYYHPDWRLLLIERARRNQTYSLEKYRREYGITPIMVVLDAFYVVSDECNKEHVIPGLLDNIHKLSGYKFSGAVEVDDDIIARFETMRTAMLESYVKRLMRSSKEKLQYV